MRASTVFVFLLLWTPFVVAAQSSISQEASVVWQAETHG
jgi:hypothetical protein